jgi:hypothetical protein
MIDGGKLFQAAPEKRSVKELSEDGLGCPGLAMGEM